MRQWFQPQDSLIAPSAFKVRTPYRYLKSIKRFHKGINQIGDSQDIELVNSAPADPVWPSELYACFDVKQDDRGTAITSPEASIFSLHSFANSSNGPSYVDADAIFMVNSTSPLSNFVAANWPIREEPGSPVATESAQQPVFLPILTIFDQRELENSFEPIEPELPVICYDIA